MADSVKSKSKVEQSFKEELGGFFHDLFRIAGVSLPPFAHERFRSVGEQMTWLIEKIAKSKSIQVIQTLQKAVEDAFNKTEAELNNVQTLAVSLHQLTGELITGQKSNANKLADLEERLEYLEQETSRRWGKRSSTTTAPVNKTSI